MAFAFHTPQAPILISKKLIEYLMILTFNDIYLGNYG